MHFRVLAIAIVSIAVCAPVGAVHENPWFKYIWSLEVVRTEGDDELAVRDAASTAAVRAAFLAHAHVQHNASVRINSFHAILNHLVPQ